MSKDLDNNCDDSLDKEEILFIGITIATGITAILGIIAFFLPFFKLGFGIKISGLTITKAILNLINISDFDDGERILNYVQTMYNTSDGFYAILGIIAIAIILLGPVIFGVGSLISLFKTISTKEGEGSDLMGFAIFYTILGWALFYFAGKEIGINLNFFSIVSVGYWLTIISIFTLLLLMYLILFIADGFDN